MSWRTAAGLALVLAGVIAMTWQPGGSRQRRSASLLASEPVVEGRTE